jgi:hypothetical protein
VFFASAWRDTIKRFLARPRLVPPDFRLPKSELDYSFMRNDMFFGNAPTVADTIAVLREIEQPVNGATPVESDAPSQAELDIYSENMYPDKIKDRGGLEHVVRPRE